MCFYGTPHAGVFHLFVLAGYFYTLMAERWKKAHLQRFDRWSVTDKQFDLKYAIPAVSFSLAPCRVVCVINYLPSHWVIFFFFFVKRERVVLLVISFPGLLLTSSHCRLLRVF